MEKGMKEHNSCGIAVKFYRLERWFYLRNLIFFAQIVYRFMQILLGCTLHIVAH